jgi:N-acetylneuraminic acid mutarotase
MLIWGGQDVEGARYRADGAAYDLAKGTWSSIPKAPLQARGRAVAVWTGTRLLVWGGEVQGGQIKSKAFADGASFDPASRQWARLAPAPLTPRGLATAVWTGSRMLVWGGELIGGKQPSPTPATGEEEEGGNLQNQGASYDPATDRWTRMARSPLRGRARARAVWTGKQMIVWGGGSTVEDQVAFADGASYDPATDTWLSIGSAPVPPGGRYEAVWTGKQMIVWGGGSQGRGAAYDPATNRWTAIPNAPLPFISAPNVVWTGRLMLVWGLPESQAQSEAPIGAGAAYDPSSRQWIPLNRTDGPAGQGQAAVWTGREMLVWGGFGSTGLTTQGAAFKLPG